MGIQYSGGPNIQNTFSGASVNSILDGIHNGLLDAGWSDLPRFRAHNNFDNFSFGFYTNAANGGVRSIGPTSYLFLNNATVCPEVQIEAQAPGTFVNWAACVNAVDPIFYAPFGGQVTVAADPNGPSYLYIVAQEVGTSANNLTCTAESFNAGNWESTVTFGGGWECVSQLTPNGLQMRVQMICDFVFGVGIVADIYIASAVEDVVSEPIQLTVSPNITYTIVADPYQFFIYQQFSTAELTSASGGTPWIYGTMVGQTIGNIVNPLNSTIQCTTAAPHGLTTGERIQILEARQTLGISNITVSDLANALGNAQFGCGNDLLNGDVIQYVSGVGSPADGYYQINNVLPPIPPSTLSQGFTLNFTYGPTFDGLSGTCNTIMRSVIGEWVVTVIDSFNFTLNGSNGTGFTYIENSAIFAPPGHIARAIWACGSSNSTNFRTALRSINNAQFVAINRASFNILQSNDTASPQFVFAGINGQPMNYSNGCAILMEPLIAAGPGGAGSNPQVFGQLWDAMLVTAAATPDLTNSLDGHNISAYSNDAGLALPFGTVKQGSLWIVY